MSLSQITTEAQWSWTLSTCSQRPCLWGQSDRKVAVSSTRDLESPGSVAHELFVHLMQSSRVQTKARDTPLEYNVTSPASIPVHSPASFSPSIIFTRALLCPLHQAVHPGVVSQGILTPAKIYLADIICCISGILRGRRQMRSLPSSSWWLRDGRQKGN